METKEEIRARMYTDESRVPVYTVPDPLCMNDGTVVSSREAWMAKRRPELLRWFEENMYGPLPRLLQSGHEHGRQYGDDRYDDQQFYQRECECVTKFSV